MKLNFIKKLMAKLILTLATLMLTLPAIALEIPDIPDAKEGVVTLKSIEPDHRVGYTVGDILTRTFLLEIKKPYLLIDESLPIIGYEKRYKGQITGIELRSITHEKDEHSTYVSHKIKVSYQIFTNSVVAKPAILPAEYLRLINVNSHGKDVVRYRIPSYEIAISPLSIFGAVKIEADMSDFRGPLLLNAQKERQQLKVALIILGLSLLGLLYILGKHAWLPRMGGPFARAYRSLRKLPRTQQGLKLAVSQVHQAINTTAGQSVFGDTIDLFLAKKTNFDVLKNELEQFFGLSRQVFFESSAAHSIQGDPLKWLQSFAKRCRDCERGLTPETLNSNKLNSQQSESLAR